ncbi:MAG: hypothetical protein RR012_07855 [Oscillospiraceae bacterium]
MISSHLRRIYKNNYFKLFMLFLLLLPSVEIAFHIYTIVAFQFPIPNPYSAFFLAATTRGHIIQAIYLWFLPIYFLIFASGDTVQDYKTGYISILISKIGKRKYFREKIFVSFWVPFFIMFFSLILNLILCYAIFNGGTSIPYDIRTVPGDILYNASIQHPFLANLGFLLVTSLFAGLSGIIGASFSFLFKKNEYVYPSAFLLWFLLVLKKDSLMYLFQPFAEYDFEVLIPIFLIAVVIFILLWVISYIVEVKCREV